MNDKIKIIADKYGFTAQANQTMEECAELIQALNKYIRSLGVGQTYIPKFTENPRENVIEEIADVQIMLEQLKYLMDCNNAVQDMMQLKIERTIERLEDIQ